MRNTVLGRILFYIGLWLILFLVLCVVSVAKNWDILSTVMSNTLTSTISYFLTLGLMVYAIVMIIRAGFR